MPTLTPGDGHDLLARFKRGWERRDVDLLVALFREDAEFREDPFEPILTGSVAIRAFWNDVAASQANVEFDAENTWISGNTVLANWHAAFTRRETAERVRHRGFMTLELDDDKLITRFREWSVARVVGTDSTFTPEPPGGTDGR